MRKARKEGDRAGRTGVGGEAERGENGPRTEGDLPMGHPVRAPQRLSGPGKNAGLTGGNWVRNRQVRRPRKSAKNLLLEEGIPLRLARRTYLAYFAPRACAKYGRRRRIRGQMSPASARTPGYHLSHVCLIFRPPPLGAGLRPRPRPRMDRRSRGPMGRPCSTGLSCNGVRARLRQPGARALKVSVRRPGLTPDRTGSGDGAPSDTRSGRAKSRLEGLTDLRPGGRGPSDR